MSSGNCVWFFLTFATFLLHSCSFSHNLPFNCFIRIDIKLLTLLSSSNNNRRKTRSFLFWLSIIGDAAMPPTYIPQMVNLEVNDVRLIRQVAEEQKFGSKGFSAALRLIIRDWQSQHEFPKFLDPPPKK